MKYKGIHALNVSHHYVVIFLASYLLLSCFFLNRNINIYDFIDHFMIQLKKKSGYSDLELIWRELKEAESKEIFMI